MTIDKIKHYLDENVYKHWVENVANNSSFSYEFKLMFLNKAKSNLEYELNNGLLKGINYVAELKLINYLLGGLK